MTTLRIGIASREFIKRRSIEIASGKRQRNPNEPKIWFTSLDAVGRVLSEKNMLLLEIIRNSQPSSLTELAQTVGSAKSNMSRTLNKLEEFGLIKFESQAGGRVAPRVVYDSVEVDIKLLRSKAAA
jgi:predicted transcriptional regulator